MLAAALIGGASAQTTVCNPTVPDACVNSYTIYRSQPGAIRLISDLRYFGPVINLRYVADLRAPDALLFVRWAEADGSTILDAENNSGFGWFNSYVSWSREWIGIGPWAIQPSVTLVMGSADFTRSFPRPFEDCPGGVCQARYYDWTANVPSGRGGDGGGAGASAATVTAAPLASPLLPGFEGLVQTRSVLQSVQPSPTAPRDLDAATFTDRYRFSSRVEADEAGGWRYVYTFENLSDVAVDFALDELGFTGRAEAGSTASMELSSEFGAGSLRTVPTIRRGATTALSGSFDALVPLQPVPEPQTAALLLGGAAVVAVAARRRRHSRTRFTAGT